MLGVNGVIMEEDAEYYSESNTNTESKTKLANSGNPTDRSLKSKG